MPCELAADLESGLRPPAPRSGPEAQVVLCCLCLSLAFTALSTLVEQLVKDMLAKAALSWDQGHFISVPPQSNSVLGKQLEQEAQGLRNFYQEKVLPQQHLVVSLEAQ